MRQGSGLGHTICFDISYDSYRKLSKSTYDTHEYFEPYFQGGLLLYHRRTFRSFGKILLESTNPLGFLGTSSPPPLWVSLHRLSFIRNKNLKSRSQT